MVVWLQNPSHATFRYMVYRFIWRYLQWTLDFFFFLFWVWYNNYFPFSFYCCIPDGLIFLYKLLVVHWHNVFSYCAESLTQTIWKWNSHRKMLDFFFSWGKSTTIRPIAYLSRDKPTCMPKKEPSLRGFVGLFFCEHLK